MFVYKKRERVKRISCGLYPEDLKKLDALRRAGNYNEVSRSEAIRKAISLYFLKSYDKDFLKRKDIEKLKSDIKHAENAGKNTIATILKNRLSDIEEGRTNAYI